MAGIARPTGAAWLALWGGLSVSSMWAVRVSRRFGSTLVSIRARGTIVRPVQARRACVEVGRERVAKTKSIGAGTVRAGADRRGGAGVADAAKGAAHERRGALRHFSHRGRL